MKRNWLIHDNTGSVEGGAGLVFGGTGLVWGDTGWYLVVLGQYNLVLMVIKWHCVSIWLLCLLYI